MAKKVPDFKTWSQENLAQLAKELWDENVQLRADNKMWQESWRKLVAETQHIGKTFTS